MINDIILTILLTSSQACLESKYFYESLHAKNITPMQVIERRGCCSWHGGVCGCSGGRALCCDGSPSPSCGC